VAILAELRNAFDKQLFMNTAVNVMTGHAVLFNRGMFPYDWATFVSMASKTELLVVIGFHHIPVEAAMGCMAGRALDLAFKDRMM
jgi:hypothetical protein